MLLIPPSLLLEECRVESADWYKTRSEGIGMECKVPLGVEGRSCQFKPASLAIIMNMSRFQIAGAGTGMLHSMKLMYRALGQFVR